MSIVDYLFIGVMAVLAIGAAFSFAAIERYLLQHGLMKRGDPLSSVIDIYKKYAHHTKEHSGHIGRWFGIHVAFAGVFILLGVVYTVVVLSAYLFS